MAAVLLFAAVLAVFMVFDFTVARLLVIVAVAAFIAVLPSFAPLLAVAAVALAVIAPVVVLLVLSDQITRFLERKVPRRENEKQRN